MKISEKAVKDLLVPAALTLTLIVGVFTVSASTVQNNLEKIRIGIDNEVAKNSTLAFSSNPFDYIKDNQYYNNIINMGVTALPDLENSLESSADNGLVEYIIALAIQQISGTDVNSIIDKTVAIDLNGVVSTTTVGWATAKEFHGEWKEIKKNAPGVLNDILKSDMSNIEIIKKIADYGILAVPSIDSYLNATSNTTTITDQQKALKAQLKVLKDSYRLTSKDIKNIDNYLKNI